MVIDAQVTSKLHKTIKPKGVYTNIQDILTVVTFRHD